MIIKEYRIILPMTLEEYRIAQLWSTAEVSKNETSGGEGIENVTNEPFAMDDGHTPNLPLTLDGQSISNGQYTFKIYHLASKLPKTIRMLAPKGSLEMCEKAWNSFPYCGTKINLEYMKDNFVLELKSIYAQDDGETENIHQLPPERLEQRQVIYIDIVNDRLFSTEDYDSTCDPTTFQSAKTGRGPLIGPQWWKNTSMPIMCCYKLVCCEFIWWGIQDLMEKTIHSNLQRIFLNLHRQMFCWMDKWHGLSIEDIRELEEKLKPELDKLRSEGSVRGMSVAE